MTGQMIPADAVREIAKKMHHHANQEHVRRDAEMYFRIFAKQLDDLLPTPPTLADMTPDEQDECVGMQADLAQGDRVVILDGTPDHDGLVQVLEKSLDVYSPHPDDVTPRPDLPRLEWPGDREAAR